MPRIDDYVNAKKIAIEKLENQSLADIADQSGFKMQVENILEIPFLNRVYRVNFPEFEFVDASDEQKEVPIQEQVLILHYIIGCDIPAPFGQWIAYREIPGASFYFSAFVKRAVDPFKNVFGSNIELLKKTAAGLGGKPVDTGDAAFEFNTLPKVPLQLILWEGDDEFPAAANILFDQSIGTILSPEDVAWLSGMLVYRLMSLTRQ